MDKVCVAGSSADLRIWTLVVLVVLRCNAASNYRQATNLQQVLARRSVCSEVALLFQIFVHNNRNKNVGQKRVQVSSSHSGSSYSLLRILLLRVVEHRGGRNLHR